MPLSIAKDIPLAIKEGDVGLTLVTLDSSNHISGFSLIFLLDKFESNRGIKSAYLIGQISNPNGMDCIRKKASSMKNLTVTLKSDDVNTI